MATILSSLSFCFSGRARCFLGCGSPKLQDRQHSEFRDQVVDYLGRYITYPTITTSEKSLPFSSLSNTILSKSSTDSSSFFCTGFFLSRPFGVRTFFFFVTKPLSSPPQQSSRFDQPEPVQLLTLPTTSRLWNSRAQRIAAFNTRVSSSRAVSVVIVAYPVNGAVEAEGFIGLSILKRFASDLKLLITLGFDVACDTDSWLVVIEYIKLLGVVVFL